MQRALSVCMDYTEKVKVVTKVSGNGSEEQEDEFDGVGQILISEGSLALLVAKGTLTIAAYAPGQWFRVKREPQD